MEELEAQLSRIKAVLPEEITETRLHSGGDDFWGIEVNQAWMFCFARHAYSRRALQRERLFLPRFSQVSPLPVPDIRFAAEDFIGYPKIIGEEFTPQLFAALDESARKTTAGQLGGFLSALHTFPAQPETGIIQLEEWDGWRRQMEAVYKAHILPQLSPAARRRSLDMLDRYFNLTFERVVIHGDLFLSEHVFFDSQRCQLSGVIDFADTTLGDAAADFICILDDCGEAYYRDVLAHYHGEMSDDFLHRVKIRTKARPIFDAAYYLEAGAKDKVDDNIHKIETLFG